GEGARSLYRHAGGTQLRQADRPHGRLAPRRRGAAAQTIEPLVRNERWRRDVSTSQVLLAYAPRERQRSLSLFGTVWWTCRGGVVGRGRPHAIANPLWHWCCALPGRGTVPLVT